MDLVAYLYKNDDKIKKYIKDNYGEIPRQRGIRFMKLEKKVEEKPNIDVTKLFGYNGENDEKYDYSEVNSMFNKYVGQDVIYIHTRCGDCEMGYDDEESNYVSCGAKEWEEKHKDLFLEHITDPFDCTYCTHYFKAVINDDYKKIIQEYEK